MKEQILDCFHVDITFIVNQRSIDRADRKIRNQIRYERMRDRRARSYALKPSWMR